MVTVAGNTIIFDQLLVEGDILLLFSDSQTFGGFQAKHREFVDCLKAGTQPSSCFADALKTMDVAEKILAQATLAGV